MFFINCVNQYAKEHGLPFYKAILIFVYTFF